MRMPYDDQPVVRFLQATHASDLLSEREKHLVGLAVTMTRGCQVCTRNRIVKARDAGIDDAALNALFGVVAAVNAGVAAATAREAYRLAAEAETPPCADICSATPPQNPADQSALEPDRSSR
jgi:alkylhydroperoxidase/carboxymuconolactone decarboxylase family protein YurZ